MRSLAQTATWWLALVVAAPTSEAASRLGPPTHYMREEGHRSAVVEVVEVLAGERARLRVIEPLRDRGDGELVVRGVHEALAGEVRIVGYTDRPARRTPRFQVDPAGPRVLTVPGVGPALFESSHAMRTLLRARAADEALTDRARLDSILDQLVRPDPPSRRFVLAELRLDPALREELAEAEVGVLRRTLASGELEPVAREHLLRAALPMVERWGGGWLARDARGLLASHGRELDHTSPIPSLLVTALEVVEATGRRGDGELAGRHVASSNPGVGKAAFRALAALDPARAAELARSLATDEAVHPDVRRFAARHRVVQPNDGAQ